jgi:HEAT repeat protein
VVLDLVALVRTDPSPAVSARALWAATGRGSAELLDAAIELHRARGMVFTGEKTPPISVLDAIARSGPGGYDYLKGLLRDPDPSVRRSALQKLPTCWEASREAGDDPDRIPIVVGMLDDAVPAVRSSAAWALGRAGGGALTAKGRLLELLSDDADHECREYVDTLLSMKTGADEIGPLLVRKLASADPKVRLAGCDGLDRLGSAAAPWKEALRGCSEDGDPRVKAAATALLARLPDR